MAIGTIFRQISKSHSISSAFQKLRNFSSLPSPHHPKPCINPSQGWPISSPAGTLAGFGEMVSGPQKIYNLFSDTGGIGDMSCAASTARKIADHYNPPSGISICHVLPGDSFDQYMNGTSLLPIQGMHSPLLSLVITSEKTNEDIDGSNIKDFRGSTSLGMLSQQEELQLEELLITLPPGLHEALDIQEAFYAAARSLSLDAILEYSYIARSGKVRTIKCATKKIKFAKQRKGSMKGISHRGNFVAFGNYALQVLEPAWITSKQLEAGRRALSRIVGRAAKIWVRAICDKPVTTRPAETRMGRGKGSVSFWVAVVQPGRILYEVSGVSESIAKKAITVAASKLPVNTRFIIAA